MQAYSYRRFSSKKQSKGTSLTRQTKASQEFAKRHGWTLSDTTFNDLGVSAFNGNNVERGQLSDFLQAVQSGAIATPCVLIVESLDRVSRDKLSQALSTFQLLLTNNVTIATVSDNQVYPPSAKDDLGSSMVAMVNLHRAHEESKIKSDRAKAYWEAAREGRLVKRGGRVPWWLERDNKGIYTVIEDRAKLVKELFELYIGGVCGRELIEHMNSHIANDKTWTATAIRSLLTSYAVIGLWIPRSGETKEQTGEPIKVYPPVITEKLFYVAQEFRNRRNGERALRGKSVNTENVFKGIIRCSGCSGSVKYSKSRKLYKGKAYEYRYLSCNTYRDNIECASRGMFDYSKALDALKYLLSCTDTRPPAQQTSEQYSIISELEGEVSKHKKAVENYEEAIGNADGSIPSLVAKLQESIDASRSAQDKLQDYKAKLSGQLDIDERIKAYAEVMLDIDSSYNDSSVTNKVNARLRQLGITLVLNSKEDKVTLLEQSEEVASVDLRQLEVIKAIESGVRRTSGLKIRA
ncbi:recombinase family protein [Endozoicomonas sp. ALD040]|uniref:recombinase family protein n=1 Tax=Endozoicomonas sp. ALD040 TaxID=3403079 RepID=UPI003BB1C163